MGENFNVKTNLYKLNNGEKLSKDSPADTVPFHEDITIMKTEIKEEIYDFEMPIDDIEYVNVKEEYNCSVENVFKEEDLEIIKSTEQTINEDLISGNCHLREEDLQKKLTLYKKHLQLKRNKAERKNILRKHILVKQDEEFNRYKCADCKYTTQQKHNLERHIRTHTNNRPFKCTYKNCECTVGQDESCNCDICAYAATEEHNLKMHILRKHSGEPKKYKCADCKYAAHIKQDLERHIMHIHSKDKPFKCTYKNCECTAGQEESCKCDMCRYAAAEEYDLKLHIMMKHSGGPKKYKCPFCKYSANLKHDVDRHIRTHTNERPFKCTYKNCECTAGQKESCKCDMCGYAAKVEYNLKEHIMMKHTGGLKKYKCADCMFAAHRKHDLERHIRIHTNDRPFKCTYKECNCRPEQKEFCKCNPCRYSATYMHILNTHILRKHSAQ